MGADLGTQRFPSFKMTRSIGIAAIDASVWDYWWPDSVRRLPRRFRQTRQESLETLTTNANDPTAILAQLKIEEDYTPDEYGTQAEPNTIQIQPVHSHPAIFNDALAAVA